MSSLFKGLNQLQLIFTLRYAAIVIQFVLILFVNLVLDYQLPWMPLIIVILAESLFTLASFFYYRKKDGSDKLAIFIQVNADILFLSLLLYFSGGATNAFVSLLLIPIAIAAVTLGGALLATVAVGAIGSYSLLLWQMPMHVMHGNMEGHFIGMWINFLFSSTVVAIVVGKMARSIHQRERAIAQYREELLKQEQVISLGVASAQVTHQIATPIATVQLLADELLEDSPSSEVLIDMQTELARCRDSLDSFRKMTFDIKEQTVSMMASDDILIQIQDHIALNYPEIEAKFSSDMTESVPIKANTSLFPAVFNFISNAVRATKQNESQVIEVSEGISDNTWQLTIRDFGKGFTVEKLAQLGVKPVESKQGLGMAVFLSYASLEKLGGKMRLENHELGGALVTVTLPLATNGASCE